MTEDPTTLDLLKDFALKAAGEFCEKTPVETICSTMIANNRILAAAIIESGGEMLISTKSVYEMLGGMEHVAAVANDDGSITLTLASRDEIISKRELLPL